MNSLPLSPVHFSLSSLILRDFLLGKPLLTNPAYRCSTKLVPRPFRAQQKKILVCIKFDIGGNSLPKHFERTTNIRSNL